MVIIPAATSPSCCRSSLSALSGLHQRLLQQELLCHTPIILALWLCVLSQPCATVLCSCCSESNQCAVGTATCPLRAGVLAARPAGHMRLTAGVMRIAALLQPATAARCSASSQRCRLLRTPRCAGATPSKLQTIGCMLNQGSVLCQWPRSEAMVSVSHLDSGSNVYAGVAFGRQQFMTSGAAAARLSVPHQARGNSLVQAGFGSRQRCFSAAAAAGSSVQLG